MKYSGRFLRFSTSIKGSERRSQRSNGPRYMNILGNRISKPIEHCNSLHSSIEVSRPSAPGEILIPKAVYGVTTQSSAKNWPRKEGYGDIEELRTTVPFETACLFFREGCHVKMLWWEGGRMKRQGYRYNRKSGDLLPRIHAATSTAIQNAPCQLLHTHLSSGNAALAGLTPTRRGLQQRHLISRYGIILAGNIHGRRLNLIEEVSSRWILPESKGRLNGCRICYQSSGRVVFL